MTIARQHIVRPAVLFMLSALPSVSPAQTVDQLVPHRVKLEAVEFKGKRAIKVVEDGQVPNGEAYAVVKGTPFHNGTIEMEMAGLPAKSAFEGARGFIGVAFRLRDGRFEDRHGISPLISRRGRRSARLVVPRRRCRWRFRTRALRQGRRRGQCANVSS